MRWIISVSLLLAAASGACSKSDKDEDKKTAHPRAEVKQVRDRSQAEQPDTATVFLQQLIKLEDQLTESGVTLEVTTQNQKHDGQVYLPGAWRKFELLSEEELADMAEAEQTLTEYVSFAEGYFEQNPSPNNTSAGLMAAKLAAARDAHAFLKARPFVDALAATKTNLGQSEVYVSSLSYTSGDVRGTMSASKYPEFLEQSGPLTEAEIDLVKTIDAELLQLIAQAEKVAEVPVFSKAQYFKTTTFAQLALELAAEAKTIQKLTSAAANVDLNAALAQLEYAKSLGFVFREQTRKIEAPRELLLALANQRISASDARTIETYVGILTDTQVAATHGHRRTEEFESAGKALTMLRYLQSVKLLEVADQNLRSNGIYLSSSWEFNDRALRLRRNSAPLSERLDLIDAWIESYEQVAARADDAEIANLVRDYARDFPAIGPLIYYSYSGFSRFLAANFGMEWQHLQSSNHTTAASLLKGYERTEQ